jgi:hypothetical protein
MPFTGIRPPEHDAQLAAYLNRRDVADLHYRIYGQLLPCPAAKDGHHGEMIRHGTNRSCCLCGLRDQFALEEWPQ